MAAVSAVLMGAVGWTGPARASGGLAAERAAPAHGPDAAAKPEVLPAGHSWTVTLITGDVVGVRTVRGRPPLVTVTPGPGHRGGIFTKFVDSQGDIEVLPASVMPLIGRVLDPALFNVTTLIQHGDDDAHRSSLPLIIEGHPGGLSALPSLVRGLTLSSIGAVGAAEPRRTATKIGGALAAMARAVARSGRVTPGATGGIGYIWLDRTIRATSALPIRSLAALSTAGGSGGSSPRVSTAVLDHNLVQIGAPAAWKAGDTGAGVKVAVLDTGVDGVSGPARPDRGRTQLHQQQAQRGQRQDRPRHVRRLADRRDRAGGSRRPPGSRLRLQAPDRQGSQ